MDTVLDSDLRDALQEAGVDPDRAEERLQRLAMGCRLLMRNGVTLDDSIAIVGEIVKAWELITHEVT